MPTAMVTFNGRITLPTDIRKQLGLKTGDNVDFVEIEKGRFAICPRPAETTGNSELEEEEAVSAMAYKSAASAIRETVQ